MKKFTSIKENLNQDVWTYVVKAEFDGFEPCEMKGSIEVEKGTPEGDVGELIDKKMDSLINLKNYEIISIDKK
jgi:hypothetical protein